ncbi:glycine cleavage system aminomethyltransferase GcvT [Aurantiacibacter sediminis]|uniref:aminomethyltransferase n=1 Tax=Aurantiacibacter sediminis TaxID=2793064 RepID=A0ABS0N1E3_9SPHN|nr:glycine cleavage system aminomethyltransferase GcvT [Aurantiacibacter sediminis]MBH5321781.1 glycine cleavage system aminomethyltransferase GcvT [Aurantiacibacter sediminis]
MSDTETEIEEQAPEKLPLDAWHRAQGGRMVPFAGYEMPIQYEGIKAEHDWTRSSVSLFDVSHMGQLSMSGDNAAQELEKLLPNGIANLGEGKMRYSLLLNDEGGIIDDLIVTNAGPHLALVVNGACKWDDIAHLREHLPDEITLTHYDDFALLALQGPKAADVLESIIPGVGDLTFMTAGLFKFKDQHVWVSRAGYTGEDGFEISIHEGQVEDLANALVADERVKPAGLGARDSLRLEAALPLYGHDLSLETDPVSASLTFAIAKARRETGGYLGHAATISRLDGGSTHTRIGLALEGRQPAREGAFVYSGDEQVGHVTSGGFSPTLGHPIAMAYVQNPYCELGTDLEIEVRGKRLPAKTVPFPFVPHKYHRKGA